MSLAGNPSGVFSAGSCACTNAEAAPWWAMHLGGKRTVYAVKMYNRADCCGKRCVLFVLYQVPSKYHRKVCMRQ